MSNFDRKIRRRQMKEQQMQKIDYQLHKAQQLELINQNLELIKNNVYGQTQVDIVLFAMSEGKSVEDAVNFSVQVIEKMNEVNLRRVQEKRKEIEERMKANNPNVPPVPQVDDTHTA